MGLLDLLFKKKSTKTTSLSTLTHNNTSSLSNLNAKALPKNFKGKINDDILKLLWFADGPLKNYNRSKDVKKYNYGIFEITLETSLSTEPSAIYTTLPVSKPININRISDKIGYFPSYENLTSTQKWFYLYWLSNPYDGVMSVDIGYVFIFYYGLERHLLLGNFDSAFDTILNLRKVHKNNSFLSYSQNALILSCILHKRADKLNIFLSTITLDDLKGSLSIYLLAKYLFKFKLSSEELILMASEVEFKNNRYIKNEYALFKTTLNKVLQQLYLEPYFSLELLKLENSPKKEVVFFANYSVNNEKRFISIPDLTQNKDFKEVVYSLLSGTHEAVKKELKEQRKTKIKPSENISNNTHKSKAKTNKNIDLIYSNSLNIDFQISDVEIARFSNDLLGWIDKPSLYPEIQKLFDYDKEKKIFLSDKQFDHYFKLYNKAEEFEKKTLPGNALDIYIKILNNFIPMGTAYYVRPAIILEKYKKYDEALIVCCKALLNPTFNEPTHNKSIEQFSKRINRLLKKKLKEND